ncbi:MAG: hypothetical protein JWN18_428 [Parcubacteria group bacterium]|nr:hypothetical protein [Parcubacteria group bacterium]
MNAAVTWKALFACITTVALAGCWNDTIGERIGVVTDLQPSNRLFCKHWEVQISQPVPSGPAYRFYLEDDSLIPQLRKALADQKTVKIGYNRDPLAWCHADSDGLYLRNIDSVAVPTTRPAETKTLVVTQSSKSDSLQELVRQNRELITGQKEILTELRTKRAATHNKPKPNEQYQRISLKRDKERC